MTVPVALSKYAMPVPGIAYEMPRLIGVDSTSRPQKVPLRPPTPQTPPVPHMPHLRTKACRV
eukprot:183-Rhodomonas_salina.1